MAVAVALTPASVPHSLFPAHLQNAWALQCETHTWGWRAQSPLHTTGSAKHAASGSSLYGAMPQLSRREPAPWAFESAKNAAYCSRVTSVESMQAERPSDIGIRTIAGPRPEGHGAGGVSAGPAGGVLAAARDDHEAYGEYNEGAEAHGPFTPSRVSVSPETRSTRPNVIPSARRSDEYAYGSVDCR